MDFDWFLGLYTAARQAGARKLGQWSSQGSRRDTGDAEGGSASGTVPSDHHPTGVNPRRDGDRVAIACWLRLPSDGDKPHRNEESRTVHRVVPRSVSRPNVSRDARAFGGVDTIVRTFVSSNQFFKLTALFGPPFAISANDLAPKGGARRLLKLSISP
jgi:hypothetical protein